MLMLRVTANAAASMRWHRTAAAPTCKAHVVGIARSMEAQLADRLAAAHHGNECI
jgi:hypothetical protein